MHTTIVGTILAGLLGLGGWGTPARDIGAQTPGPMNAVPPAGARAVVQVSPNPTTKPGEEVTITGNCGGGSRLIAVTSGANGGPPALVNVRIINNDPNGFEAKATVAPHIGNGVGPVFVDCGNEVGVTLLVTHV